MILVRNLRLDIGQNEDKLKAKAARELRVPAWAIKSFKITKRSLDSRKKNDIHWLYSVALETDNEAKLLAKNKSKNIAEYEETEYPVPRLSVNERPIVAGFGPGGMFAALVLSMAGLRPIVLERGADAETRKKKVDAFRSGGELDPECNVQFGEGGAGTFSDGKLGTGIRDKRIRWILRTFYEHGAPESILYDAKPHIGTDILINVVQGIRESIIKNGGEVLFNTKLTGLIIENNALRAVKVTDERGEHELACSELILAIGHSARDTFEMLEKAGIPMEAKPFSMGARIEHKQRDIDLAQYGESSGALPAADYSLNVRLPDSTSAYTFCMCPGGEVIAAASEPGGVCTNGMSNSRRDAENANSALLVTLQPEDFPYDGPLGGMRWQRDIEHAAFAASGSYRAPAQTVGDFLAHKKSDGAGAVTPSYRPGVYWCDLHEVLPERITGVLENALPELGKKLKGFDAPDAVLTAPETRSSSPVRILRDDARRSQIRGLYPCGEGAGYAGGITSAAVDGMKCAEALIETLK